MSFRRCVDCGKAFGRKSWDELVFCDNCLQVRCTDCDTTVKHERCKNPVCSKCRERFAISKRDGNCNVCSFSHKRFYCRECLKKASVEAGLLTQEAADAMEADEDFLWHDEAWRVDLCGTCYKAALEGKLK